jgi:hypothetical protein
LWRSHILRVRTSYAPALAAALVHRQADPNRRMTTEQLREFVKRVNRVASNVVLLLYDEGQAETLLNELSNA